MTRSIDRWVSVVRRAGSGAVAAVARVGIGSARGLHTDGRANGHANGASNGASNGSADDSHVGASLTDDPQTNMPKISPLAVVDPKAKIAADVEIGPFCVVGPHVTLGRGNRLISHVVIAGHTTIGENNTFYPHCVIGTPPQDLKYRGEPTGVEIGSGNHIREHVTIHAGTVQGGKIFGGGFTRIGDNNLLMVNCHVGHDAQVGSRCILANNVMLAGHIILGNNVVLNGGVGVNAWVSIGDFAYVGGYARIHHDIPPFVKVSDADEIRALNELGLRRGGFNDDDIDALDQATRRLFLNRGKPFSQALADFDTMNGINPHVKRMVEFLRRRDQGRHGRYLEGLRIMGK